MIKTLEKILLKVNKQKAESVYFDITFLTIEEWKRFQKLVLKVFKIKVRHVELYECVGLVELSRKIDSLYFIKYGRRL